MPYAFYVYTELIYHNRHNRHTLPYMTQSITIDTFAIPHCNTLPYMIESITIDID